MLKIGQPFPAFKLKDQDARAHSLSDYSGKWLVVYVYPKDDTPGCTIEGKAFSAAKPDFDRAGVAVVGLSEDDVSSHKSFCQKFGFTIPLLADPEHELLKATGVQQSEYKGTMYWDRTTFLIDPKGILRKTYLKVNPQGHEKEVLADIQQLRG